MKSQTMKAVRIHKYGEPEVLQYEDLPRPQVVAPALIGSFRFTIFANCERLPREANCVVKLALQNFLRW